SSYTLASATNTPANLTYAQLSASTTGQYKTQCIQTASNISSWGSLSCDYSNVGAVSEVLYATSAVSCAALPSTPPDKWTSQTNNSPLTTSTNAALAIGIR